jgi:hypothetical protein
MSEQNFKFKLLEPIFVFYKRKIREGYIAQIHKKCIEHPYSIMIYNYDNLLYEINNRFAEYELYKTKELLIKVLQEQET